MWKSVSAVALLVFASSTFAQAQFGRGTPPVRYAAGHGVDVPGWWARFDNAHDPLANLRLSSEGSTLHAVTGPAAIFWDPQKTASGQYTVSATFAMNRMPRFEEGYGLFIGGANLDKDNERLTAFLIREDGSYAIRQRRGMPSPSATVAWISDPAIATPQASGHETNELTIRVGKEDVIFLVNGKEVTRRPAAALDTDGIVGLRLNNNLDVRVEGFTVRSEGSFSVKGHR